MKTICYRELKRRFDLDGPKKTTEHLVEALQNKDLSPEDFSFRDLAEATISDGREWVRTLDPRAGDYLMEGEAVDTTSFLNISGQIILSKILESYRHESFVTSKLVDTISSRMAKERIAGIGKIESKSLEIHEGMKYPHAGFGEEYVDTPETTKHGLIVPVTREAIFYDQTGLILRRASEVGEILGIDREKRILKMILGITNTYNRNGVNYDTYYSSTDASAPWINEISGNSLEDWTNVDTAEQLFTNMLDPNTQEPILMKSNTILVMPGKRYSAARIFNSSEISWSSASGQRMTSTVNPLQDYKVLDSAFAYRLLLGENISAADAKEYWYIGDFKKAFAYIENWPITVTRSSRFSEADFSQDILIRFKASERGTPAVLDPRCVICNKG
ncbi:MAG: hypothetical protein Q4C96_00220 [Planctomycetia bacterium]|nr:hypothetical protein [Planctomycetia bacterium]